MVESRGYEAVQRWLAVLFQVLAILGAVAIATGRLENRLIQLETKFEAFTSRVSDLKTQADKEHADLDHRIDRLEQRRLEQRR